MPLFRRQTLTVALLLFKDAYADFSARAYI